MILHAVVGLFLLPGGPEADLVLRGLDPVELCAGRETPGREASAVDLDGLRYLFATDENRTRFEAEPERYAVQMGGGCGRMGPLSGSCSPERFAVHDGRIYLFASDACRATFLKSPARFLDADDPPLVSGQPDPAAAQALLAKALEGLGGASRVDAVRALRLEKRGVDASDGKQHVTRDVRLWRMPDDLFHETAWDEWAYPYVVTPQDAFSGSKHSETLSAAARHELRKQLGREPLWLLRHRTAPGFTAVAAGSEPIGATQADVLKLQFEGATTTLWIDPASGRILRTAWRGRFGTGSIGQAVVDHSDFRETGGLVLPHAREVSFDGLRDEAQSGTLDALEVDPVIGEELFTRRP